MGVAVVDAAPRDVSGQELVHEAAQRAAAVGEGAHRVQEGRVHEGARVGVCARPALDGAARVAPRRRALDAARARERVHVAHAAHEVLQRAPQMRRRRAARGGRGRAAATAKAFLLPRLRDQGVDAAVAAAARDAALVEAKAERRRPRPRVVVAPIQRAVPARVQRRARAALDRAQLEGGHAFECVGKKKVGRVEARVSLMCLFFFCTRLWGLKGQIGRGVAWRWWWVATTAWRWWWLCSEWLD